MVPLIDGELQQVDKKHNELMSLNKKLIDSFQMYTKLMAESAAVPQYSTPNSYMMSSSIQSAGANPMPPQMPSQQAYQTLPAAGLYNQDPAASQVCQYQWSLSFTFVIFTLMSRTHYVILFIELLQLWRLQWTSDGSPSNVSRSCS